MSGEIQHHLKNAGTWTRLLFMLLFAIFYSVAEIVLLAVIIFQFLYTLVTGKTNARALRFGAQLSTYAYQVFMYLTYNTEERPFPFTDWPAASTGAAVKHKNSAARAKKTAKVDEEEASRDQETPSDN